MTADGVARAQPAQLELVREYPAPVEDLWALWSTRDGIESWWGPEGFTVEVAELDLRVGGAMVYTMVATAPPQVEFMRKARLPLSTEVRLTYTAVRRCELLAYEALADFVPGVDPYPLATTVQFEPIPSGARMTVRFDRMHDEQWTQRARMGRESELEKLARLLQQRTRRRPSACDAEAPDNDSEVEP
jgi:uncharacterized protein YndB with AHSA1/START domain